MAHTSRRRFLKGVGAALASAGVVAGSSALSTTTAAAHHNQTIGERVEIEQGALATLVVEQLQEWVAVGRSFTAYDVTRALRAHHAGIDIGHAAVRVVVYHRMTPLLARQLYRQQHAAFATGPALRYVPA
jgi:hypothetical protein